MKGNSDLRSIIQISSKGIGRRMRDGQYIAAEALLKRLYRWDEPGVILADEVGLGKTYVALAVAAWRVATNPNSRVLVLTNSQNMAKVWETRWDDGIGFDRKPWSWVHCQYDAYRGAEADTSKRLVISSYETLKSALSKGDANVDASLAAWFMRPEHRPGTRLSNNERRRLMRELGIDGRRAPEPLKYKLPVALGRTLWREHFQADERTWHDSRELVRTLRRIETTHAPFRSGRRARVPYDLTIVDEAHRLNGTTSGELLKALLGDRTRKVLYVTATPFALDVDNLSDVFRMFGVAADADPDAIERRISALDLKGFEKAVERGEPYPAKPRLEKALRRWVVRRTWEQEAPSSGTIVRRQQDWAFKMQDQRSIVATLALERTIAEMLLHGGRTHIASRREGLCSSWAAARASFEHSPIHLPEAPSVAGWAQTTCDILSDFPRDSPKVRHAAVRIAAKVRKGQKVLVFSERAATLTVLERRVAELLKDLEGQARRRVSNLLRGFRRKRKLQEFSAAEERALLRVFGSAVRFPRQLASVARRWRRTAAKEIKSKITSAFHEHRAVRSVEIHDGTRGDDSTLDRFNLPGSPWVLLCSRTAQESIDLHRECGTLVLFDPVWNPAVREQRIGRIQRIGSRFRSIEVIDVYSKGTYEERIVERSRQRAKMMRVLLGAGKWLNDEIEIEDLSDYLIDLSPRSPLEDS